MKYHASALVLSLTACAWAAPQQALQVKRAEAAANDWRSGSSPRGGSLSNTPAPPNKSHHSGSARGNPFGGHGGFSSASKQPSFQGLGHGSLSAPVPSYAALQGSGLGDSLSAPAFPQSAPAQTWANSAQNGPAGQNNPNWSESPSPAQSGQPDPVPVGSPSRQPQGYGNAMPPSSAEAGAPAGAMQVKLRGAMTACSGLGQRASASTAIRGDSAQVLCWTLSKNNVVLKTDRGCYIDTLAVQGNANHANLLPHC